MPRAAPTSAQESFLDPERVPGRPNEPKAILGCSGGGCGGPAQHRIQHATGQVRDVCDNCAFWFCLADKRWQLAPKQEVLHAHPRR